MHRCEDDKVVLGPTHLTMAHTPKTSWRSSGIRRLLNALRYQREGILYALRNDSAIRQVSAACTILSVLAIVIPASKLETLILVASSLQVVLVEYLNSAIETTVDRISLEPHPLSKSAKDLGRERNSVV